MKKWFIPVAAVFFFFIAPLQANDFGSWGIDLTGMDPSQKPGDNFYGYVNGAWAERTEIPPDKTSIGSFDILEDVSEERVHAIIKDWAHHSQLVAESDEEKVASIYRSFLNEEIIENLGIEPLEPYLRSIKDLKNHEELAVLMARSHFDFGHSFFRISIGPDYKNPKINTVFLSQSGLGLPDRSYYFDEDKQHIRAEYLSYLETMLKLIGWDEPEKDAAAIFAMETRVANAHWTRAESRNRDKTYNPSTIDALIGSMPDFAWKKFLETAKLTQLQQITLRQNTAILKLAKIYADTPLATLKAWAAFHIADKTAPFLSRGFVKATWEFRSQVLEGAKEQRPRWKRAVSAAENLMGEAIGRTYVAQYFPPDSKNKMEVLVDDVLVAFKRRIKGLSWMSQETKEQALQKLSMMRVKIGYPSKWLDYSTLAIREDDLLGNMVRGLQFDWEQDYQRIEKEVDKEKWGMTPQTVNAYHNFSLNEIVFPAAILQPPFFNPQADSAVNYGAIAAIIGHEITHGFDDQGRKSDGSGVLREWWTLQDETQFNERALKLGAQYQAFTFPDLPPGSHINPALTMGENIGDLGGVLLGLDAYKLSLNGQSTEDLDGFSGIQRVFLGWAQAWRTLMNPESKLKMLATNPHSPGEIRAFASLRNINDWYEAFNVEEGQTLYLSPEARVSIWQ